MTASRSGVLPVDKPEGPTSHDIVAAARRALGVRRIGHTGTLDPFASGLLLLCVGTATRIAEYLTDLPKTYRARMRLGVATDTCDATGTPVFESEAWRSLDRDRILEALRSQVGRIRQVPPAYSAKKVAGERAYERVRRGEDVKLEPVEVEIYRIDLLGIDLPDVEFDVECSSGTYVRAIARDVGAALGVGAHLRALRRTAIGRHHVSCAVPADRLDDPDAVESAWLSPLEALSHLPRVEVDEREASALRHGRSLPWRGDLPHRPGPIAIVHQDALLAIGEFEDERLRPRKVLA